MPPKLEPAASSAPESSVFSAAPAPESTSLEQGSREKAAFERMCLLIEQRFAKIESKIEAFSFSAVQKFQSLSENQARGGGAAAEFFESPFGSRNHRQYSLWVRIISHPHLIIRN
jgi:hypothetical protein